MKKLLVFILLATVCLSMCACGSMREAEVVVVPSKESPQEESEPAEPVEDPDAVGAEALFSLLDSLYTNYHPGTAGSSLKLVSCAGALLDWYELEGSVGAISRASSLFAAAYPDYAQIDSSSEIALGFPADLSDAWRCSVELSFPSGQGLLESSGYVRESEVWDVHHTDLFFTQLFTAFALDEPNSIKLYFGNGDFVKYPAETNEYAVTSALRIAGVLDYNTQLLSFSVEEGIINLDLSAQFTAHLNSLDSSSEHTVLHCIVYTFLDAFGADSISITVDGLPLVTERNSFESPIARSDI